MSALPSSCDLVRVCFLFFLQRLRTQREEVKLAAQFAGLKIRLYCIFSASPPPLPSYISGNNCTLQESQKEKTIRTYIATARLRSRGVTIRPVIDVNKPPEKQTVTRINVFRREDKSGGGRSSGLAIWRETDGEEGGRGRKDVLRRGRQRGRGRRKAERERGGENRWRRRGGR